MFLRLQQFLFASVILQLEIANKGDLDFCKCYEMETKLGQYFINFIFYCFCTIQYNIV